MGVHPAAGEPPARMTVPVITGRGHEGHAPYVEVQGGRRIQGLDRIDRIDRIVTELRRRRGFELREPRHYGAGAVERVHDSELLAFLDLASDRAEEGEEGLLFADTFMHASLLEESRAAVDGLGFKGLFGRYCLDTITGVGPGTYSAALEAADAALTGAEEVHLGAPLVVALTRPPGHHVSANLFGGGCFLNNAALATEFLRDSGRETVAVLDLDVHHGNGTQSIFYERADVLFVSVHASPAEHFPLFLGFPDETGAGAGAGWNLNLVLPVDADLMTYRRRLAVGLDAIADFEPDVLVVSLGVDTHREDPSQAARLESDDYERIGADVAELGLPTLVLLEGGYNLDVIGPSVVNWLEGVGQPAGLEVI